MKNSDNKKYIYWGVTILLVILCSLACIFVIFKMSTFLVLIKKIIAVFKPFIYGMVLAYLLMPIFSFCHTRISENLYKRGVIKAKASKISKGLSTAISMLFVFSIVVGLISLVLPQLIVTISSLAETLPKSMQRANVWLIKMLHDYPEIEQTVIQFYSEAVSFVTDWIKTDMVPQISMLLNGIWGTVSFFTDVFVGIFVCIYVLNSSDLFCAQAKKITYSIFDIERANLIIGNVRFVHRVFGGFINGKLLDSLIIAFICFFGMSMLNLPYAMLISVIIGVTNIIPFFGPFIGAVPSAILILFVSPIQTVYFLIFVLILQQFDGNILGPKILGNSTGLSSFWVLFSIIIFGGFFGFFGMIVGVPFFAVIYSVISGIVKRSLYKKDLPTNTNKYFNLDHIEDDLNLSYEKSELYDEFKTLDKKKK